MLLKILSVWLTVHQSVVIVLKCDIFVRGSIVQYFSILAAGGQIFATFSPEGSKRAAPLLIHTFINAKRAV